MVEWNDAYSLGAYDMDATTYTNLLIASRWEEVLEFPAEMFLRHSQVQSISTWTLNTFDQMTNISTAKFFVGNRNIASLSTIQPLLALVTIVVRDAAFKIDMETVSNSVHDFDNTDDCTSAYAADFGVLNNGETAMVELNDGYSLSAHDMDATTYSDLLIARWEEVMKFAAEIVSE
eukprot:CAMPEP_0201988538 /NCGR_PEP_ID=MMETSP0904-20121228/92384_1 /ASSEMBLY_ACC=CAM_ASM_000553 /TAXON_ID=420261 /ORGANISM="Thalassiosira antarctica, Strain CCMP982" /LENGTH=175 /DNA_ID=CAMNT_0048542717 /DNA_START=389 /DNA_END=918 /DNA_ORIENTATION=-